MEDIATDRLVLEPERRRITAVARSRWYLLEGDGQAPRRRLLGNRSAWLLSELLAWIRAQPIARHDAPTPALRARGIDVGARG